MAYVTKNRNGNFEIRESQRTSAGPRSKTLASFRTLEHQHLVLAAERSSGELDRDALVAAARKAGAPVALAPADEAATQLLRAIGDGGKLNEHLAGLLRDALSEGPKADATNEAFGHIGISQEQRGAMIIDLLLLTDAIPRRDDWSRLEFPGIPETSG
jgi:hypothetical protein